MQNTMMQKSEFSKIRDCSGFLQIGSHISAAHTFAAGQQIHLSRHLITIYQSLNFQS